MKYALRRHVEQGNPEEVRAETVASICEDYFRSIKELFELSDEERKVMNTFLRNGIMTKEEYIAEVKKARGAQ